jgi:hypothetical protein
MSQDRGAVGAGFSHNFAYGTLALGDAAARHGAAARLQDDAVAREAVDRQGIEDDGAGGFDHQAAGRRARSGAVQLDQRRAGEARLGGAVDRDRAGDRRQGAGQVDVLDARAGDVEPDRVGAGAALAPRMACRRLPAPALLVLLTVNVAGASSLGLPAGNVGRHLWAAGLLADAG